MYYTWEGEGEGVRVRGWGEGWGNGMGEGMGEGGGAQRGGDGDGLWCDAAQKRPQHGKPMANHHRAINMMYMF